MQLEYGRRLARVLSERFGGEESRWLRAHDAAWEAYVHEADSTDWEQRPWAATVDRLDARFITSLLEWAGVAWRPDDAAAYSRQLEYEVMSTIDARFPDARTAVDRTRTAGHRVYVATQASDSNARGSLTGAGLLDRLDGIFTGSSQGASKTQRRYWSGITDVLGVRAAECALVDDRLDYLKAAGEAGFATLLVDREGVFEGSALPAHIRAVLPGLAGLPRAAELLAGGGLR